MELKPSQFTRDEFDVLVTALIRNMGESFHFHTNKTGKMRDVLANTLFDLDNGFKSALSQFKMPDAGSTFMMPEPMVDFELPDTLCLLTNEHTNFMELHAKPTKGINGRIANLRDPMGVIWKEAQSMTDLPEVFESAIYEAKEDQREPWICLENSQLMRYLAKHYHVVSVDVDTPSYEAYGPAACTTIEQAITLASDLLLDTQPLKESTNNSKLTIRDRQDDGEAEILLTLTRKSQHHIAPMMHTGFNNCDDRVIDFMLIEPLATKLYDDDEARNAPSPCYTMIEIANLVEPDDAKLNELNRPISLYGRIIGYARSEKGLTACDAMLKAWLGPDWATASPQQAEVKLAELGVRTK